MENIKYTASEKDTPIWKIRVDAKRHLDNWIEEYLGSGFSVIHGQDGNSVITGELPDISAVYGFIPRLRDSGIFLLSMKIERR